MLSFGVIFTLLLWLGLVLVLRRLDSIFADAARQRAISILGSFIIIEAFLLEPWVKFDFVSYFIRVPESVDGFLPKTVKLLGHLFDLEGLPSIIGFLNYIFNIKIWQLQFLPSISIFVRISTLLPFGVAMLVILYIAIVVIKGRNSGIIWLGIFQVFISITNLLLLTIALNSLDLLGIKNNLDWALLAIILGAKVSRGAFLSQIGLVVLAIGGQIEISSGQGIGNNYPDEEWWNE